MSIDTGTEQRLKFQMDQVQVHLRPGLAHVAYRAHRRQRAISRSIAIVAAAAVIATGAAIAALAMTPSGAGAGQPGYATGPASSLGFVPSASLQPAPPGNGLTAQQAIHDIQWQRITWTASPAADSAVSHVFTYGSTVRDIGYHPDGKPDIDRLSAITAGVAGLGTSTQILVYYRSGSWLRLTSSAGGAAGQRASCAAVATMGLAGISYNGAPDAARALLACPGLTVTRGQRVDGIGAVKVTDRVGSTLWINAATGLPIQLETRTPKGLRLAAPGGGTLTREVIQFGYLAPTTVNLAYLRVPIPAGFRQG